MRVPQTMFEMETQKLFVSIVTLLLVHFWKINIATNNRKKQIYVAQASILGIESHASMHMSKLFFDVNVINN